MAVPNYFAMIPDNEFAMVGVSELGQLHESRFFVADEGDKTGTAFCFSFQSAMESPNNRDLCACWGSMVCQVATGLRHVVRRALDKISIRPSLVHLPSEAAEYSLDLNRIPRMDWPDILVSFGCCILVMMIDKYDDEQRYQLFMQNCIQGIKQRAGYDPQKVALLNPFDLRRAEVISKMMGNYPVLREHTMRYLLETTKEDPATVAVCDYLCEALAWSRMTDYKLTRRVLCTPASRILMDPRVSRETDSFHHARNLVENHPRCRLFMHLAPLHQQLMVDSCRYPTLVAAAQALEAENGLTAQQMKENLVTSLLEVHRELNYGPSEAELD